MRIGSSGRRGVRAKEILLPGGYGGVQAGQHRIVRFYFPTVPTGLRSPRLAGQERQDEEPPTLHGGGRTDTGDGRAGRGQRGDLLASAAAEPVDQGWRPGRAGRGGPRHDGLPAWLADQARGGESAGTGG